MRCSVAVHCSALQYVAVCCSVWQCAEVVLRFRVLLHTFIPKKIVTKISEQVNMCYCMVQCAAVCCSVLQCAAVRFSALQCVAVCCIVLQCVAVRRSVLQCVAVC